MHRKKLSLEAAIAIPIGHKIICATKKEDVDFYVDNAFEKTTHFSPIIYGETYIVTGIEIVQQINGEEEAIVFETPQWQETYPKQLQNITEVNFELFGEQGSYNHKNFYEYDPLDMFLCEKLEGLPKTAYDFFLNHIPQTGLHDMKLEQLITYFELATKDQFEKNLQKFLREQNNIEEKISEYITDVDPFFSFLQKKYCEFFDKETSVQSKDIKKDEEHVEIPTAERELLTRHYDKKNNEFEDEPNQELNTPIYKTTNEYEQAQKNQIEQYKKTAYFVQFIQKKHNIHLYEELIDHLETRRINPSTIRFLKEEGYITQPQLYIATMQGYEDIFK